MSDTTATVDLARRISKPPCNSFFFHVQVTEQCVLSVQQQLGAGTPLHAPLISTGGCARYTHINPITQVHVRFWGYNPAFTQTAMRAALQYTYAHRRVHILCFWAPSSQKQCDPWNHLIYDWMRSMKHLVWLSDEFTVMPSCERTPRRDCWATSRVLANISGQNFLAFERLRYSVTDGLIGWCANITRSHSQAIKDYCLSKPFASRCCLDQTNLPALWGNLEFKELFSGCQTPQLYFSLHSHIRC